MSRVLITGAAGRIGTTLRRGLPQLGWTIRGLDRVNIDPVTEHEDSLIGDLGDEALLDAAMRGVDAVVHLAAIPTEAPYEEIRRHNIDGTFEVFDAARRAGVPRIVFASSIHATGFSPKQQLLRTDEPPHPDTHYGVSKVFGEMLGRMYADRYGMQVACLRIGAFEERPGWQHSMTIWLSPGDAVRLVHACLSSPDLGYAVLFGVSANTQGWLDLEPARRLGYEPKDDSEAYAANITPDGGDDPLGGFMTEPSFDAEEIEKRWASRQ